LGKKKLLNLGLILAFLITVLVFVGGCIPEGTNGEEGGFSIWTMLIFLVAMFAVMYFVLIRPQQKKQKEHQQMMEEMKRGDRVITAGGIYGRVESINDDSVVLKVESGATIRVARSSVAGVRER
jgi:preprotein translocase subunit YajC